MQTLRKRLLLFLALLLFYFGVFTLIESYKESRVKEMLSEQAKYLQISYNQGVDRFNVISKNIYLSIQNDKKLINLVANTNDDNLNENYKTIFAHLEDEYHRLTLSGVMGLMIISPQSKVIARMHKKGKYGDDLGEIRPLVKAANEKKIHMFGFEEGKTSHAYREVYPLYNGGKYIGLVEILFSSTKLQDYTMRASNIHTHFIVNRNVFHTNEWKSKAREPYEKSIEHKDYLFSLNDHINHDKLELSRKTIMEPLREDVNRGIESGKDFNIYKVVGENARIVVFKAVKRFVDDKTVAYIVSYSDSKKLYNFLNMVQIVHIILGVLSLIVYVVSVVLLRQKETITNELKYDGLTNIYNRKYFLQSTQKECQKQKKENQKFCIVMADIDLFKSVNDTYGHQSGDVVLKEFADILKSSIRREDRVARYGGEEFIILLLTGEENSHRVIEGIRKKVQSYKFDQNAIKLTASFGIAECQGESSLDQLIKRADIALYKAKENGRNRIELG